LGEGNRRSRQGATAKATPEEELALQEEIREGRSPCCPRCASPLLVNPIPPRPDVSYVRRRVLVDCEACGFRTVIDRR
jgi:hypothetical protein